jgi:hypothetical protein
VKPANETYKKTGGCSEELRAMHQRIDIISLLYFWAAENPVIHFALASHTRSG